MNKESKKDFISINEYLNTVNLELAKHQSRIIGEVTEVQMYPGRSYLFFKIKNKDEENPAILTCIMWKRDYDISGLVLEVGLEIIISGTSSVHKPTGRF